MRFLSHASLPVPFPTLLAGGSEWSLAFFFVLFCHWLFFGYAFLVTLGEQLVLASAFCTLVRCLVLALQLNLFVSRIRRNLSIHIARFSASEFPRAIYQQSQNSPIFAGS